MFLADLANRKDRLILRTVESCLSLCNDKMCLMPAAPLLRIVFIEQDNLVLSTELIM